MKGTAEGPLCASVDIPSSRQIARIRQSFRAVRYLRPHAGRLSSSPTETSFPPPLPYQADQRGGHHRSLFSWKGRPSRRAALRAADVWLKRIPSREGDDL